MNNKQREAFEKWVKTWGWCTDVDSDGYYEETPVQMAWNAWQAAIASVVVKLPVAEQKSIIDDDFSGGVKCGLEIMLDRIKDNLDKAGIRYE